MIIIKNKGLHFNAKIEVDILNKNRKTDKKKRFIYKTNNYVQFHKD